MTAIRSRLSLPSLFFLLALILAAPARAGQAESYTFFEGTQYPLTVYFLRGDKPGPTVMVQGGIQGDESCGYITAQVLARSTVLKGNLIVVPRANVPSVNVRKRQVNVDLNRRFDRDYNQFYEDRLARAIRHLLAQSDAFIHLHEGSGFYDPVRVDENRNPNRWGQSVIVDALVYGGRVDMAGLVKPALEEINASPLVQGDHHFNLFNTRTFEPDTPYLEMRKTLTCYALAQRGIPALAVEVSKSIKDIGLKVRQQMWATTVFLRRFGVEMQPMEVLPEDVTTYAQKSVVLALNGQPLSRKTSVALSPAARIEVTGAKDGGDPLSPVVSVFASDRPGMNLLTTPRMALSPFDGLEVRSDGNRVGMVDMHWKGAWPEVSSDTPVFVCWLNNEVKFVKNGETLRAVRGDQLVLEGVWKSRKKEVLNFKGYVSGISANKAQDAGAEIILDPENFMVRYVDKRSPGRWRCEVVRETSGGGKARFYVDIVPRKIEALELKDAGGRDLALPWTGDGRTLLAPGEYQLVGLKSNGSKDKISLTVNGRPVPWGSRFMVDAEHVAELTLRQTTTFEPLGAMSLAPGHFAVQDAPVLR